MQFVYTAAATAAAAFIATASAGPALGSGFDRNAFESNAQARMYTGSWPVTVSGSQHSNGTSCLTLTSSGTNGGSASLVIGGQKYPYGTFQIFNGTLVATIQVQGYGQNAGFVFIGATQNRAIGPGVFDDVYGGEAFDEGALSFGKKGGC